MSMETRNIIIDDMIFHTEGKLKGMVDIYYHLPFENIARKALSCGNCLHAKLHESHDGELIIFDIPFEYVRLKDKSELV